MILTINEFKEQAIRISSSALGQIIIDGKYLLCLNKSSLNKGNSIYTPLGGALEYLPSGLEFLMSLDAKFERTTPDLRFHTHLFNLEKYRTWFNSRKDRETTIDRELVEELVEEENIFSSLNNTDFNSTYKKTVEQIETSDHSNRFFEIFSITFSTEKLNQLLEQIKTNDKLILVTKNEILKGIADNGISIGKNSEAIL